MRSRKFRGVAATAAVGVVAEGAEEATSEVVEVHGAVATEVVVEAVRAVVGEVVRARLRCRAVVEEDNAWPEAATGLVIELAWCRKVAVAEVAEGAIGPAEILLHDRIELRAESPHYPET
jgi:hypothetical protein